MTSPLEIQIGGPLNAETSLYVSRPQDKAFFSAILKEEWVNIYGSRTMGKSSLFIKYIKTFESKGIKTINLNVATRVTIKPQNPYEWFYSLGKTVFKLLGYFLSEGCLKPLIDLDVDTSPAEILECLATTLIQKVNMPLLLILDEFQYIKELPYCNDILLAFRDLSEKKKHIQLSKLILCFVGIDSLLSLGKAGTPTKSPFTKPIRMTDFERSPNTVKTFSKAFPVEQCPQEAVFYRVLELSGGQPIVTMSLLAEIKEKTDCQTIEAIETRAYEMVAESGEGDDLQIFQSIEVEFIEHIDNQSAFAAIGSYRALLRGSDEVHSEPDAEILIRYGLVRRNGKKLEVKGELFERRFNLTWAQKVINRLSANPIQYRGGFRDQSKKILIINAGGTLGMLQHGDKVVAPRNTEEFKSYFPALDSYANINLVTPFEPRDSINIFPDDWVKIATYIYEHQPYFDSVVVVHGTDTLAFTASAVAFALGRNLKFPVVFTGSQNTPDVAHADAHDNLYRACEVAKQNIHEVVVCFGYNVFRAVRSQKTDDRRFEGFSSPTYPALAEITGEINVRTELLRPPPEKGSEIELQADFDGSLLFVQQFPGLKPQIFEEFLQKDINKDVYHGIIIQTYGAGNVTNREPYSLIPLITMAFEQGIPVIITSQYPPDPGVHTKYSPAQSPILAGGIHAGNMTLAAAVSKFQWVLAKVRRQSNWKIKSPGEKRDLVEHLMVKEQIIGEF